uniref:CX domain-containing protein n=1 Tax=Globodera rostochiensis TaxID=31243 RepID=A0A914ICP0_GLORO
MAQEPRTPWSRWDLPVGEPSQQQPLKGPPALGRQFDVPNLAIPPNSNYQQQFPPSHPSGAIVDAFLVAKEPNPEDPSFYNCIYGVPNNLQQIIQECHVEVDCCERTCCDTNWQAKYAWAIVLLSLICLVVVIALIVWLIVWLLNRARDKAQRKKLLEGEGSTYASSHVNIAPPYTLGANPNGTLRRY